MCNEWVAGLCKNVYLCSYFLYIVLMKRYIVILFATVLLGSCSNDKFGIAPQCDVDVKIQRFDSLVTDYVQRNDIKDVWDMVDNKSFWRVYNMNILGLKDYPLFRKGLKQFMTYEHIAKLYVDAQTAYKDMSVEEKSLSRVVNRYCTLFPELPIPVFQTHVSGLNKSVVTLDSLYSISIDCYLGDEYELYKGRFPRYELHRHSRERIVPDVAEVMLRNAIASGPAANLLDAMVYEGRVASLLSCLIESTQVTDVLGYTVEQAKWCDENETAIWASIVNQNHLFSSDRILINKYISPAPFTSVVTIDSPGRLGRWVGWKIVDSYMRNQGMSPYELAVDTTSAVDVLRLSGYSGK